MPYQVQQIIEGKGIPICVKKDDMVSKALSLMIEHDYSQLPVISTTDDIDEPEGMITYECILRGIRNFKAKIDDLRVRDVMVTAPVYTLEDDLFDILDRLKDTNAVLVIAGYEPNLVGIVTSYDTAEYFRNRTEDLMRVEDIELMIKEFIKDSHINENGELDKEKLAATIVRITPSSTGLHPVKAKDFDDLTLNEYICILLIKEKWPFYEPIFHVSIDSVRELLDGIREIRNALAHFRGDLSPEQRDKLKFCAEWITRCQEEYQALKEEQKTQKILEKYKQVSSSVETVTSPSELLLNITNRGEAEFTIMDSTTSGGKYASLADWLQSQPGRIDQTQLTFNQIEEIIKADLPPSARNHRAWWANDTVGHSHSQLWLDAGWRTTYINLSEGRVTFSRIKEREKAYITFFSSLLNELRKKANFPIKNVFPDGASWIVIQTISYGGSAYSSFTYSFSRDKRFRVELYLDMGDQSETKAAFDLLIAQKDGIESQTGPIEWERLDNRRASRIALYHDGQISETKKHTELRSWAVESMIKFVNALQKPAEDAISKVHRND